MEENNADILYVDDEDVNLLVFKHAFKKGYNLILTESPLGRFKSILSENINNGL